MDIKHTKIDLTKGDKHEHPDIELGRTYLALIDGTFYVGTFSRVWYGLNFDCGGHSGIQFDEHGTNSSGWEGLWLIEMF